ncbi:type IV toxin-antitoxin system AbiEi family antitoxin domain-containing protein [Serinicoccus kebangsaanensis]|uniref:type IV toxin-antitoxin system AbiEi family antitoxin domain-containing protein n=1 Tax=Serinicoccus kebangsaanensis TaxID=2602069 RepID=UPI00178C236D|nr:type IV toxin-antitoxin system AbiEi family antitoxin domain-containing protein [Serinicoccus kebangsaanensis]
MDQLAAFLAAHDGAITSAEARRLGLGPNDLRRLSSRGRLRRVGRGAYVQPSTDLTTDATRTVVAMLRGRTEVAASHQSGALLWRLPVLSGALTRVHLSRTAGTAATRSHGGLTVHACPARRDAFGLVGRHPVVTPALAVVGTAVEAGADAGICAGDAALRAGLATREAMLSWVESMRHRPHLSTARHVVAQVSPTAESAAESKARLRLLALGYRVIPQFVVDEESGAFVARVDFLLPDLGVVVEVDGAVKYAGAEGRAALVREKCREDAIRRLGYGVARLVWSDLDDLERMRSIVERARGLGTRSLVRSTEAVAAHRRRTGATWDGLLLHSYAAVAPRP